MFSFLIQGLKVKEQHCPLTSDYKPIYCRNDTSSNQSLGVASSSKNETDDAPISCILSQSPSVSFTVGKQVFSPSGLDSCGEGQIRNEKSRGDVRSRNQLLPRYRPQITNEELQKISGEYPMVVAGRIVFILFLIMTKQFISTHGLPVVLNC